MPYTVKPSKKVEKQYAKLSQRFQDKIDEINADIEKHPRTGIGKPEELTGGLAGCWSRRFSKGNRLIYEIDDAKEEVTILDLYGHYN